MPVGPAPPSLYGIQQRAGQSGQSASSGAGFDLDAALNDLLSRLQLPEPEPVKPAPLPAKILMGLGDILNARAAALLRQPAPESSLSQQTQREDQQRARSAQTAEGNRKVKNEVVTSLYGQKLREDAGNGQAADKAAADERERQARLADAQRQADREHVYRSVTEYVKAGGKLPQGFNLAESTPDSVLSMISAGLQTGGVEQKLSDAIARAVLATQADPNLVIDDVNLSEGTVSMGQKSREPKGPQTTDSPLSLATGRAMGSAGVQAEPGMTELAGQQALAAAKAKKEEEDKKARETRLSVKTQRGNKVRDEIIALADLRMKARNLRAMLVTPEYKDVGGAEQAYKSETYLALKKKMFGGDELVRRSALNAKLGIIESERTKLLSGAQVTPQEEVRLNKHLPKLEDFYDVKLSKLDELIALGDDGIRLRQQQSGLSQEDIDYLLQGGGPTTPSTPLPGMKKVAD